MSEFEKPEFITQLAKEIRDGTKTANIVGTVLYHPTKEEKDKLINYIKAGDRDLTNTTEGCKNLIFTETEFNSLEPIQKSRAMSLCKVLLSIAALDSDIVDKLKPILDNRMAVENTKNIDQRLSDIQNNLAALENKATDKTCSDENKETVINEYRNFLGVIDDITKTVDSVSDGAG